MQQTNKKLGVATLAALSLALAACGGDGGSGSSAVAPSDPSGHFIDSTNPMNVLTAATAPVNSDTRSFYLAVAPGATADQTKLAYAIGDGAQVGAVPKSVKGQIFSNVRQNMNSADENFKSPGSMYYFSNFKPLASEINGTALISGSSPRAITIADANLAATGTDGRGFAPLTALPAISKLSVLGGSNTFEFSLSTDTSTSSGPPKLTEVFFAVGNQSCIASEEEISPLSQAGDNLVVATLLMGGNECVGTGGLLGPRDGGPNDQTGFRQVRLVLVRTKQAAVSRLDEYSVYLVDNSSASSSSTNQTSPFMLYADKLKFVNQE